MSSHLDYEQIVQLVADETNQALQVKNVAGSLVPDKYDYIGITYVSGGTANGNIDTVTYYLGGAMGTLVATLTMGYDGSGNLTSVTRS